MRIESAGCALRIIADSVQSISLRIAGPEALSLADSRLELLSPCPLVFTS